MREWRPPSVATWKWYWSPSRRSSWAARAPASASTSSSEVARPDAGSSAGCGTTSTVRWRAKSSRKKRWKPSRTPSRRSAAGLATATSTPDWRRCQKSVRWRDMIESRRNRVAKDIRRLLRSKGDSAVLEGPHLIGEALAAGLDLDPVLATPAFLETAEGAVTARRLARPPLLAAPEVIESLADADSPKGLLAVARLPRDGADALPLRPGAPYLYLDGLQDPGNLGAIARVAEAAGAAGLALAAGSVHPNHPRALRASAGSLLRLPLAVDADPEELGRRLAPLAPRSEERRVGRGRRA